MKTDVRRVWCKQDVLYEALLGMARNLGPGARLPTVQVLSTSLRASPSTLSPVLDQLEQQGAIVRKHGHGIYVAPTIHQKNIGIIVGTDIFGPCYSPFWQLLLEAAKAEIAAREHRYHSYLDTPQGGSGMANHAHLMRDLRERRLHGLLLISAGSESEIRQLHDTGLPLVVIGQSRDQDVPCVVFDGECATRMALTDLLTTGARGICLFGYVGDTNASTFHQAATQLGATDRLAANWHIPLYSRRTQIRRPFHTREEWGYDLMRHVLSQPDHPDAFWIEDDTVTRGALMAVREAGLVVGRDLWIATTANKDSPILAAYETGLSLLEYDPAQTIRCGADILDQLMAGRRLSPGVVKVQPVLRKPTAIEADAPAAAPGATI